MKFIIKVKDIEFEADNKEEAEDIGLDIVNDIGKNAEYKIVKKEQNAFKPKTS